MNKKRLGQMILGLLLCTITSTGWSFGKVYEYSLDNGMQVVVKPDHRAPVAISQVWYKVGSASESSGITGLSHVLEHMMFKGTTDYPAGQFSAIIAANGGKENAFTGRDYTAYYQLLGKDRLETAFKLEADRMRNLTLPQKEFEKEVEVVKEERYMRTDDNPESLTYERFRAAAFLNSPYRNPVIGWMEDLNTMKKEDLQVWYDRWYQPNNATLVVVGDVDPEAILTLAKKYFGPIPRGEVTPLKPRVEPKQRGERRIQVKAPAKVPYLMIGYHVPVMNTAEVDWEPYALEVLAGILDGGASSRFSKELVRGQALAASAGAGYSLASKHDSLFLLDITPAKGRTIAESEQALEDQLDRLRNELATTEELDRVKAQVIAEDVYQLDSIEQQSNLIGMLETTGVGWELLNEYAEKIQAVTAEQVREVAKKYFVDEQKVVGELVPDSTQSKEQG